MPTTIDDLHGRRGLGARADALLAEKERRSGSLRRSGLQPDAAALLRLTRDAARSGHRPRRLRRGLRHRPLRQAAVAGDDRRPHRLPQQLLPLRDRHGRQTRARLRHASTAGWQSVAASHNRRRRVQRTARHARASTSNGRPNFTRRPRARRWYSRHVTIVRVHNFSISLDGYAAGRRSEPRTAARSRRRTAPRVVRDQRARFTDPRRETDGASGIDDEFAARAFENLGAWIMGRNMFGPVRGPWPAKAGRDGGATTRRITSRIRAHAPPA